MKVDESSDIVRERRGVRTVTNGGSVIEDARQKKNRKKCNSIPSEIVKAPAFNKLLSLLLLLLWR